MIMEAWRIAIALIALVFVIWLAWLFWSIGKPIIDTRKEPGVDRPGTNDIPKED